MDFKKITLEDRPIINEYLRRRKTRSCEMTFANTYLWSRKYPTSYAIIEDMLVFRGDGEAPGFTFPWGDKDPRPVLEKLETWCRQQGQPFVLQGMTEETSADLETLYPGQFEVTYDRDAADYVYETEKLANLSGKKYHGKKNHINKFKKLYPDWSYESLSEENAEECFQMTLQWRREKGCEADEDRRAEVCVALNFLRLLEKLELCGGVLRVNGAVAAYCVGEPVCDDTMVVHIEKALTEIEGAYTMINQQFALHQAAPYRYLNREEDLGEEGLRRAKLSYRPEFLIAKGTAVRKQG